MTNDQKLIEAFGRALVIPVDRVTEDLAYNAIAEWDSIGHMTLIAELENVFEVMLDTDEIIAMNSVSMARQILAKHGAVF